MQDWDDPRKWMSEQVCRMRSLLGRVQRGNIQLWERLAGPLLGEMLASPQVARERLSHAAPGVRQAAIGILAHYWWATDDPSFRSKLEEMSLRDADAQVRAGAVLALGGCYTGSDDVRIGRLLAALVYDEGAAADVRYAAYVGLFRLRGVTKPVTTEMPEVLLQRIDRTFVDGFLVEGRVARPVDHHDWKFE